MSKNYYHAGPKGLSALFTARELIASEVITIGQYATAYEAKWGDAVLDPWSLMSHPAIDEICFTLGRDEAEMIASSIDGCVYICDVDEDDIQINNEGYPSVQGGEVACRVA